MGWCDGIHCALDSDGVCVDCGLQWTPVAVTDVPQFLKPSLNLDGPIWKRQVVAGEIYRHMGLSDDS